MSDKYEYEIAILSLHRENLSNAKTFEEYRDHHIAYVDFLISRYEAKKTEWDGAKKFADRRDDSTEETT